MKTRPCIRKFAFAVLICSLWLNAGLSTHAFGESNDHHVILVYALEDSDGGEIRSIDAVEHDGHVFAITTVTDPDHLDRRSYDRDEIIILFDSRTDGFTQLPGRPDQQPSKAQGLFIVNDSVVAIYEAYEETRRWMYVYNVTSSQLVSQRLYTKTDGLVRNMPLLMEEDAFMYRSRPHAITSTDQESGNEDKHLVRLYDFMMNESTVFEIPTSDGCWVATGNDTHMMLATGSHVSGNNGSVFLYNESSDLSQPSLVLDLGEGAVPYYARVVLTDKAVEAWLFGGESDAFCERRVIHADNSTEVQLLPTVYGLHGTSVGFVPSVGTVALLEVAVHIGLPTLFALVPDESGAYSVSDLGTVRVANHHVALLNSDHVLAAYVGHADQEYMEEEYGLSSEAELIGIAGDFSTLGELPDTVEMGFTFVERYQTLFIVSSLVIGLVAVVSGFMLFRRFRSRSAK